MSHIDDLDRAIAAGAADPLRTTLVVGLALGLRLDLRRARAKAVGEADRIARVLGVADRGALDRARAALELFEAACIFERAALDYSLYASAPVETTPPPAIAVDDQQGAGAPAHNIVHFPARRT